MKNPRDPQPTSDFIPAGYIRDLTMQGESLRPLTGIGTLVTHTSRGTNIDLARRRGRGGGGTLRITHPFQIYQHTPAVSDPATDWRNFRVRAGTITEPQATVHPVKSGAGTASDDFDVTPANRDVLIPENTHRTIYIRLDIDEDVGNVLFTMLEWMDAMPGNPVPSFGKSYPANFHIPVGEITVGSDDPMATNFHTVSIIQLLDRIISANAIVSVLVCRASDPPDDPGGLAFKYQFAWYS